MSAQTGLDQWRDVLEARLAGDVAGPMTVRVYRETASTQDVARGFAPGKALVLADQQTAGRGRLGRRWASSPGASVLMSLCWPMEGSGVTHDRVSMLAGVAVARAVERVAPGVAVRLKWPNDVMIDGRKLAGILCEAVGRSFVIGIGLNATADACADPAYKDRSTSLAEHGCHADRVVVIEAIVRELIRALTATDRDAMLDRWRSRTALGQSQTFEHNNQHITGETLDLDPDHGLIVRRDTGEIITLPAATTSVVLFDD